MRAAKNFAGYVEQNNRQLDAGVGTAHRDRTGLCASDWQVDQTAVGPGTGAVGISGMISIWPA